MIMIVGEIAGCLIAAAGIGGLVGWLLRQVSVTTLNQHIYDVTTALQAKEQALQSAQLELKAKASTIQIYEGRLAAMEVAAHSAQQDLVAHAQQLTALQEELVKARERVMQLEAERRITLDRYADSESAIAASEEAARLADVARTAVQQDLVEKEKELAEVRARLGVAEESMADLERLRTQVAVMETAQGRAHWLEVQLSEKEAQHRAALHEFEQQRARLVQRISDLEPLESLAQAQADALHERDAKYSRLLKQQMADANLVETQRGAIQDLQSLLTERDRTIQEQANQVAALQRRLDALDQHLAHSAEPARPTALEKTGQSRLRTRPAEIRTARAVQVAHNIVMAQSSSESDDRLSLEIGRPQQEFRRDDLTKIRGIDPTLEQALNEMGTYTYVQIAKWTPRDVARIAQRLATPAARIKRDNWVASAKKRHREKYGERV
jgi:predicted flap endonuclease-1-like 5' DNA nuclease